MAESGFDTSKWQAGAYAGGGGFTFGLTKATEGNGYADPTYGRHLAAIKAHGLIPGAYAFSRPDLGNTAEGEADWFLRVVGDPRGMLLALDLEVGSGNLASYRDRFCDRVQAKAGKPCWWYSYSNFVSTRSLNTSSADYPFWLAWPDSNGALPRFAFGGVAMQQYGLTPVPGVSGGVDANRFFGSLDQLRALAIGGAPAPAPPPPITAGGRMFIPYDVTKDPFDEVYADVDGECRWGLWVGGGGQAAGWVGDLTTLGSPGGAKDLVQCDGAHTTHDGGLRLNVRGVRANGERWILIVDLTAGKLIQGWTKMPSTPRQFVAAAVGPAGPPGPAGAAGPPGETVTDDHIAEVAVATMRDRLQKLFGA